MFVIFLTYVKLSGYGILTEFLMPDYLLKTPVYHKSNMAQIVGRKQTGTKDKFPVFSLLPNVQQCVYVFFFFSSI